MAAAARCKVHVSWTAILRVDSEHVSLGIVVREVDRRRSIPTFRHEEGFVSISFCKKPWGLAFSAENAEDKLAHPRSAPKQCHSIWTQPSISNLGRIEFLVNPKARPENMKEGFIVIIHTGDYITTFGMIGTLILSIRTWANGWIDVPFSMGKIHP